MRFQSKKQAAIYQEWSPKRNQWLHLHGQCMICGAYATEVHEIFNGPIRMKAFINIATWLSTCTDCNQNRLTDKKEFPIERQLAIKLLCDPLNFNLMECAIVCSPRQISIADILLAVKELLTNLEDHSCPRSVYL